MTTLTFFSSASFISRFRPMAQFFDALLVVQAVAVAGDADHVLDARRRPPWGSAASKLCHELVVVLDAVEALVDAHAGAVGHGAGQAVLLQRRPLARAPAGRST